MHTLIQKLKAEF